MQLPPLFTSKLASIFVERFSTAQAVRDHHGRDESPYPLMAPDGVVFARTNEEVSAVLRLCDEYEVPVIEVLSSKHFVADLTIGLGEVVYDYLAD